MRNGQPARAARHKPRGVLISRNVRIAGDRRTSVRLESEMWDALYEIAALEDRSIHDICTLVDRRKQPGSSFSSALRVYLLRYYRIGFSRPAGLCRTGGRAAGHDLNPQPGNTGRPAPIRANRGISEDGA